MHADEREYSIEELAAAVQAPVRTIRFYIGRGLLPGPGARGRAASYGEEHLVRLQLIRLLGERRVPLDEIGQRLAGLDLAEARELLADERGDKDVLDRAAASVSPKEYVAALLRRAGAPPPPPVWGPSNAPSRPAPGTPPARPGAPSHPPTSQPPRPPTTPPIAETLSGDAWQRWEIAPGIELHARADASARYRALIARLLRVGREDD